MAACVGDLGPRPEPPTERRDTVEQLAASDLRRLTGPEYSQSLADLFGQDAVVAVEPQLGMLPDDRQRGRFRSMVRGVTADHVDAYYAVGRALATWVTATAARRAGISACLAAPPFTDTCVKGAIAELGARMLRRPLKSFELTRFWETHERGRTLGDIEGFRLVVLSMTMSPAFLYRLELEGDAAPGRDDTYGLTGHELATRLSFLAWGTTPDAELLASADTGELGTDEGLERQVARLFDHPRARAHVAAFFAEWLGVDPLPRVSTLAADPGGLAHAMREELDRYVQHHVFDARSDLHALFTSPVGFVAHPELARVYGLQSVPDGDGRAQLDGSQRAGLLTRAALLAGRGARTHPIQRGAWLMRTLLCDAIPPPDRTALPDGALEPPPFDPSLTARQRWDAKTADAACATCHARINPLGYTLESYDVLGRWREREPIVDPETHDIVAELPIDTRVTAELDGKLVEIAGAAQLGSALAAAKSVERCLARQWLELVMGRASVPEDRATLDAMVARTDDAPTLLIDILARLARSPEFGMRRVPDGGSQ